MGLISLEEANIKASVFVAASNLTVAFCTAIGQGAAGAAFKAQLDPAFQDSGENQVAIWVWDLFKIFNAGLEKAIGDATFGTPLPADGPGPRGPKGGPPPTPAPAPTTTPAPAPTPSPAPAPSASGATAPVGPIASAALNTLLAHLGLP